MSITPMPRMLAVITLVAAAMSCDTAFAWGPEGHHTVGEIAEQLIAGSHASVEVATLLDGITLRDAAVWADCAKGVDPKKDFAYTSAGKYPECKVFETPALEAEMSDYVRRNDSNCPQKAGDPSCHTQYHYTDAAIQRSKYTPGTVGTQAFDVVAAVSATIHVLKGEPAPSPFSIKDQREALLLLAHFVGDLHQPLHVGSVYLDAQGQVVDPDAGTFDPATGNRGGNEINVLREATNRRIGNLHQSWDDIPEAFGPTHVDAAWLKLARAVPKTSGDAYGWSTAWATQTLTQARAAFDGLQYGPMQPGPAQTGQWTTTLPYAYDAKMAPIKKKQLTAGGARLAQVLQAIWP